MAVVQLLYITPLCLKGNMQGMFGEGPPIVRQRSGILLTIVFMENVVQVIRRRSMYTSMATLYFDIK